jgi:hypothetical protein
MLSVNPVDVSPAVLFALALLRRKGALIEININGGRHGK